MVAATFLDETRAPLAVVFLSFSMMFTGKFGYLDLYNLFLGMHTPGCQAALVAVAPAFVSFNECVLKNVLKFWCKLKFPIFRPEQSRV